jgi:phthalate 4,5-dioxygenase reductase subunit
LSIPRCHLQAVEKRRDCFTMTTEPLLHPLSVAAARQIARDIYLFELRDRQGAELAEFTAGAHLSVQVPAGVLRKYSLCNDPAERDRYVIAVKREKQGGGGSLSLVDGIRAGDTLQASAPRNDFALHPRANSFIFIAGGIGITPILSMVRHVQSSGRGRFKLYYFTRDPGSTAFIDELGAPEFHGKVRVHHDGGDAANAFDLWPVLERPSGAHVYCCGPRGLMDSVRDMSGHWPGGSIHFESFGPSAAVNRQNTPFTVQLAKSGLTVAVAAESTILEAVRAAGVHVPSSCESGTCGSCKTVLISGEAEHRDLVLAEEERGNRIMVCCSRAVSAELVLDL